MVSHKRVVIAGLGDSGVLTAIRLARHAEVVGISAKPALVSGQELGWRLSRPHEWARANLIPFDRFRGLDRVRTVHGTLSGLDLAARTVIVRHDDGSTSVEGYDALVISTGVTNGFWRQPNFQSADEIGAALRAAHDQLAGASSVVVVGGGAAAVSSAANLARTWPQKRVDLYFPGERALLQHHPRAWERVEQRLGEVGVVLHSGHRAVIPDGFACDQITGEPVQWSTGQPPTEADAVLWAIGRCGPTPTGCLPTCSMNTASSVSLRNYRFAVTGAYSRSAMSRRRTRSGRRLAIGQTACWPITSARSSKDGRCAATARRSGDGVRCSVRSGMDLRCSRRTAARSDSPRGRSTVC